MTATDTANKYDQLLQKFISDDPILEEFSTPRTQEVNGIQYAFATDGRQVCRIPLAQCLGQYPAVIKYPFDVICPQPSDLLPTPITIQPEKIKQAIDKIPLIPEFEEIECTNCEGEGEFHCPCCGNITECKTCDGAGYIKGKETGKIPDRDYSIRIEQNTFAPQYLLNLLHAHETTQQPIQLLNTSHKALFSVGDIQIIIMACINN